MALALGTSFARLNAGSASVKRMFRGSAGVWNADAADWIKRVEANSGSVSTATANAVTTFCNAIDAAGIRDRFYRLNLFAGTGLNACLVPLYRGPTYSPDGLGPELWSVSTPSFTGGFGSDPAWDASTLTFSNNTTGTAGSVPRFSFTVPIVVGRRYKVSGKLSGDTDAMSSPAIRLGTSGFDTVTYNSTTGVFDGTVPATATVIQFLMDGTLGAKSVTIDSVSIREVLTYGNTTDTNNGPFVSGDYAETGASGGLKGNGTSKNLDTGLAQNTFAISNAHISASFTELEASGERGIITCNGFTADKFLTLQADGTNFQGLAVSFTPLTTAQAASASQLLLSRTSTTAAALYLDGTSVATSTATITAGDSSATYRLFFRQDAVNAVLRTAMRLRLYTIGLGLSATQASSLASAVSAFNAALGR